MSCLRSVRLPNLLQRYKFESNSQLAEQMRGSGNGCQISCKDTNLKAIHNPRVDAPSRATLPNLLQSYKFESNSQHALQNNAVRCCCQISCKDTNLKAIHNAAAAAAAWCRVAKSPAKIQIWKQFTTCTSAVTASTPLPNLLQRYKFESNSQLWVFPLPPPYSCQISCKDTNLKAIHNGISRLISENIVAKSPAKIQIWKQFTTDTSLALEVRLLPNLLQRYKFESNSQL